MNPQVKIFAGRASRDLGEAIAKSYGIPLGEVLISNFSDGEFQPSFEETVRGCDIFIVQSTPPPSDNLFELLLMVDAAKRASARKIIAVMPYFGLSRQDRKDKPRVPIGSKLVANLLTASGVNRLMTLDLHADQIQGFFEFPVDHLFASSVFIPYVEALKLPNLVMAAPDTGGTKRANAYAKYFHCDMAICYKKREKPNEVAEMTVIGEVAGKDIVLVDDMIDTAGTLTKAADMMMAHGANSVRAICSHPILSGSAYERINNSKLTELIVTDTVPLREKSDKISVISIAPLFADVIHKVQNLESISKSFIL